MSGGGASTLAETLALALTQCQEQIRTIQQQASHIEQLLRDNDLLRRELEDVRLSNELRGRNSSAMTNQVQDLFQENIILQAENERLHKKLRVYKKKARERLGTRLSSPAISSPATAPQIRSKRLDKAYIAPDHTNLSHENSQSSTPSPPRKKLKAMSKMTRDPLSELSSNISRLAEGAASKFRKELCSGQSAADWLGEEEDGIDQRNSASALVDREREVGEGDDVHDRLDALLADSRPAKSPLARRKSRSPISYLENSVRASNATRTALDSELRSAEHPQSTVYTKSKPGLERPHQEMRRDAKLEKPSRVPLPSNATENINTKFRASETREPLRNRSPASLSLHHFKPSSQNLGEHRLIPGEGINSSYEERIRTLAATLPSLPGQSTYDAPLTDEQILMDYLGAGAESVIANFSSNERQELLARAKMSRVAEAFAARTLDYGLWNDAPGFWSADMPGTQEEMRNKADAKEKERVEVEQRHHDAMTNRVRWVFADE